MRHPFCTPSVQIWCRIELVCVSNRLEVLDDYFRQLLCKINNDLTLVAFKMFHCRSMMLRYQFIESEKSEVGVGIGGITGARGGTCPRTFFQSLKNKNNIKKKMRERKRGQRNYKSIFNS